MQVAGVLVGEGGETGGFRRSIGQARRQLEVLGRVLQVAPPRPDVIEEAELEGEPPAGGVVLDSLLHEALGLGEVEAFLSQREAPEDIRGHEVRRQRGEDVEDVVHAREAQIGAPMLAEILDGAQPCQVGGGLRVTEGHGPQMLARRVVRQLLERPRMR